MITRLIRKGPVWGLFSYNWALIGGSYTSPFLIGVSPKLSYSPWPLRSSLRLVVRQSISLLRRLLVPTLFRPLCGLAEELYWCSPSVIRTKEVSSRSPSTDLLSIRTSFFLVYVQVGDWVRFSSSPHLLRWAALLGFCLTSSSTSDLSPDASWLRLTTTSKTFRRASSFHMTASSVGSNATG